jgi:cytochrome b subunit of formate dehydrogenase
MTEKMNNSTEEKYIRMSLNERVQHFFLLTSFITLVITGFALKFPEALWVSWIRDVLGGNAFDWRGGLHRIAAVIMVAVSVYHVFYIIFNRRGRQLVKDLWFKRQDITDLLNAFKYYIGKTKTRPKYGRFSYIEKAEYWAVVWGTIVMGGTGGVLWFENTFLPVISNSGMDLATAIHFYEAILASLAIFVWHFYFVIYNPDVYPMNKAWYRGYLTREEMELEHPLELEEIEKENTVVQETEIEKVLPEKKPDELKDEKTETETDDKNILTEITEEEKIKPASGGKNENNSAEAKEEDSDNKRVDTKETKKKE